MTVREQKQVSPEVLDDVVHRVVAAADPERIMMFGSAARGAMRPDSDLDLLVIKAGRYEYHRVISDIYKSVAGAGIPVEIVLITPEQAERYKDSFCLVIHPALKEGKVIYDGPSNPMTTGDGSKWRGET